MKTEAFLESLRDEVLEPDDIVDVEALHESLHRLEGPIASLQANPGAIADLLNSEDGRSLIGLLLGVAPWELEPPDRYPPGSLRAWKEWTAGESLRGVVVGLLLREAHGSRSRRRRTKLVEMVKLELERIVGRSRALELRTNAFLVPASRSFDFVVSEEGEPILAVLVIFQTRAGGRQTEIFEGLPELQSALIRSGIILAVVADGPGFRNMAYVVRRIAPRLQHLLNAKGLGDGELRNAIRRGKRVRSGELRIGDTRSEELLERIAMVALRSGRAITPTILNLPVDEAEAFLVRFAAANPDLELEALEGTGYTARASQLLAALSQGPRTGEIAQLLAPVVADHLGYAISSIGERDGIHIFGLSITDARLRLPDPLPVIEFASDSTRSRADALDIADELLRTGPVVARMGLAVDTGTVDSSVATSGKRGVASKAQFAVLGPSDVADILMRSRAGARSFVTQRIVQAVDLSLISPFVSEGPTSPAMFFGREAEIRRIMEQVGRQSFALVGGRKAGKTSILRRLDLLLAGTSAVAYLDCQAHPDRADFLAYVAAMSNQDFGPGARGIASAERTLSRYLEQIMPNGGMILLDEVDDLFLADSRASDHPHVLSRAFRSISQRGAASIVVTGERALYSLTRDPTSPHWNFCTPIVIGPLNDDAARDLLLEPLSTLGVDIQTAAVELALETTARHPNLLQYMGDQLIQRLAPQSTGGQRLDVIEEDVESLSGSPTYRQRFTTTFWSQATSLEKWLSVRLSADEAKTLQELTDELRTDGAKVRASAVEDALSYLELYTIVRQTTKGYSFRDAVFNQIMGPLRGSALAKEWLGDIS